VGRIRPEPKVIAAASARKVGIFGGTFDPIHIAHLRCAEEARELLDLDSILLVPSADPPHKRGRAVTAARHRLAMVRKAAEGHPSFQVSTIEIDRTGLSFTIDTLRQLARSHPHWRVTLLMGIDAFAEIDTWKEYEAIFQEVDLAVLSRPPTPRHKLRALTPVAVRRHFRYSHERNSLIHKNGNRVSFLSVSALDISASDIRDRARQGRSIRYLVLPAVERYIERQRLYRTETETV
jgi:nicotinate-nucleotide adenylyltransferase